MVGSMWKRAGELLGARMVPGGGKTVMTSLDALVGTAARMVVLLEIVKSEDATLPNMTPAEAVKFTPLITTFVPGRPLAGVKLATLGRTKKFVDVVMTLVAVLKLCVVPSLDINTSGPLVTPAGAVTCNELSLRRTGVEAVFLETTPLNMALVTPPKNKCTPVIVTVVSFAP